jgi:hypothetical protein
LTASADQNLTLVSPFWKSVGHKVDCPLLPDDLAVAVEIATRSDDIALAFRRNRELIDLSGRFLIFRSGAEEFVVKIARHAPARRERRNAQRAQTKLAERILRGDLSLQVAVPAIFDIGEVAALVLPYFGGSLDEDPDSIDSVIPYERLIGSLRGLLRCGIECPGFLPRNLFPGAGPKQFSLIMIDWEEAYFHKTPFSLRDTTIFKWTMGWSDAYEDHDGFRLRLEQDLLPWSVKQDVAPLDRFERTLRGLTVPRASAKSARERCDAATLLSERGFPMSLPGQLRPRDVGHLVEDLLPASLSVFYTFATAHVRRTAGEQAYACLQTSIVRLLFDGLRSGGARESRRVDRDTARRTLVSILIACITSPVDQVCERLAVASRAEKRHDVVARTTLECAVRTLEELANASGPACAVRRSAAVDVILQNVFDATRLIFGITAHLDLLVRGSLGQCMLTCRSDVDFEISGPQWKEGHQGLESLVIETLSVFGLRSEGSSGRPREGDIVGKVRVTRDLHEWVELRRPGSHDHDVGWLRAYFDDHLRKPLLHRTLYERQDLPMSPKLLFGDVRMAVARAVWLKALGPRPTCTSCQLDLLERTLPQAVSHQLRRVVDDALILYEGGLCNRDALVDVAERLDLVRAAVGVTGRAW